MCKHVDQINGPNALGRDYGCVRGGRRVGAGEGRFGRGRQMENLVVSVCELFTMVGVLRVVNEYIP